MQILQEYTWPGNIRELENLVERVSVCAIDAIIRPSDLPPHIRQAETPLLTSQAPQTQQTPHLAPTAAPINNVASAGSAGSVPQLPWLQSSMPPQNSVPAAHAPSAPFPANVFAGEQGWNAAPVAVPGPVAPGPVVDEVALPYAANEDGERRAALVQSQAMAFAPTANPALVISAPAAFAPAPPAANPQWTTPQANPVGQFSPHAAPQQTTQTQQVLAGVEFPSKLPCDLPALLRQLEWAFIDEALKQTGGNKQGAANLLGLRRTTLVEKLRRKRAAQTQAEQTS
ncbi:MAG: hypothetical protein GY822_12005 [Deltaproteobacteria bacterium]|nr:hypothetical protein [Deltaproteobacteria bacterium]